MLEHLHNRDQILREIHRALTPGGKLLLSVPNRDTGWKVRLRRAGLFSYSDADHKIEYTAQELTEELRRNGFVPEGPLQTEVLDTPWVGLIDLVGIVIYMTVAWMLLLA